MPSRSIPGQMDLLNDQFNYNSGFKDKDGKLYFGGVRGMITFYPMILYLAILPLPYISPASR